MAPATHAVVSASSPRFTAASTQSRYEPVFARHHRAASAVSSTKPPERIASSGRGSGSGVEPLQQPHLAHAHVHDVRVRVGDGGRGANGLVGLVADGERRDAHEAAVALRALARRAAAGADGRRAGEAAVEHLAVWRVGAGVEPIAVAGEQIGRVDVPAVLDERMERGKRHGRVVRPCARRPVMRAMAGHAVAMERPAPLELVRDAERVADGEPVEHAAYLVRGHSSSSPCHHGARRNSGGLPCSTPTNKAEPSASPQGWRFPQPHSRAFVTVRATATACSANSL